MRRKFFSELRMRHRILALAHRFSGRGINEVDSRLQLWSLLVLDLLLNMLFILLFFNTANRTPTDGDELWYLLPTTHYLLLTTLYSLLTTLYSLLTTHYSLLTTHYRLLTTYYLL